MPIPNGRGPRYGPDALVNRQESEQMRSTYTRMVQANPYINGTLLQDVALVVGQNNIEHTLKLKGVNREIRGFHVEKDDAQPVRARVYRNAAFAAGFFVNAASTLVTYDTAVYDWTSAVNLTTGVLTFPHTGLYRADAVQWGVPVNATDRFYLQFFINGSFAIAGGRHSAGAVSNLGTHVSGSFLGTIGQTFDVRMHVQSTVNCNGVAGSGLAEMEIWSDDDLRESRTTNPDPTRYLTLYSARVRTVDLWVW